jgi:hypothetical protein
LGKLKKVSPRVRKESNTKAHRNDIVWLGDYSYCAPPHLLDRTIDAIDAETYVMPAGGFVTGMKIGVCGPTVCARARQKLEYKAIVPGRRQKGEGKTRECDMLFQAKAQLPGIPGDGSIKIGYANRRVIHLPGSKRVDTLGV